jgi:hypothetical protein
VRRAIPYVAAFAVGALVAAAVSRLRRRDHDA